MKSFAVTTLIAAVLLGTPFALALTSDDRIEVERAVLDYVEGVYELRPELIERSVHPELKKFGFARRSPSDDWRVIPMTYDQLVELLPEDNPLRSLYQMRAAEMRATAITVSAG